MKKLKEFIALDKYPFADEGIRHEIINYVGMIDNTIDKIAQDPTLTQEAKTLKAYKDGIKLTGKIAKSIKKSIDKREREITTLKSQLKSQQLRQKPLTSEQSALMGVIYNEIKSGQLNIKHTNNDNLLKIGLALADSGLIEDISHAIDEKFTPDVVQAIADHTELINFEWDLLQALREYEIKGLNEQEALELDKMRYKGVGNA